MKLRARTMGCNPTHGHLRRKPECGRQNCTTHSIRDSVPRVLPHSSICLPPWAAAQRGRRDGGYHPMVTGGLDAHGAKARKHGHRHIQANTTKHL